MQQNFFQISDGLNNFLNYYWKYFSVWIPLIILKLLKKKAFNGSSIESISIPSDISELQDGWRCGTSNLTKISIIQRKIQNIRYFDDNKIVGKSDIKSSLFDVLLFAPRNIKIVTIPPTIKQISSHAFAFSLIEIFFNFTSNHINRWIFFLSLQ